MTSRVLVILVLITFNLYGQNDSCISVPDTLHQPDPSTQASGKDITKTTDASLLFSSQRVHPFNSPAAALWKISWQWSVLFSITIRKPDCSYLFEVFDETGQDWIQDSLFAFSSDQSRLRFAYSVPMKEKRTEYSVTATIQTPKFKNQEKDENPHSIFSPGELFLSAGLRFGSGIRELEIGMLGMKVSYMMSRVMHEFYAAQPPNPIFSYQRTKLEGGICIRANTSDTLLKKIKLEFFSTLFVRPTSMSNPEMECRGKFTWLSKSPVKASIIARYTYDPYRFPPGRFNGELGFTFAP